MMAYESCYAVADPDNYRPLWWFTDEDKQEYCRHYGVKHSCAYSRYGFKRTGCACCPFSLELPRDRTVTKRYEPKLYKAIMGTFGKSFDYTERYYRFRVERELSEKRRKMQTPSLENWTELYGVTE